MRGRQDRNSRKMWRKKKILNLKTKGMWSQIKWDPSWQLMTVLMMRNLLKSWSRLPLMAPLGMWFRELPQVNVERTSIYLKSKRSLVNSSSQVHQTRESDISTQRMLSTVLITSRRTQSSMHLKSSQNLVDSWCRRLRRMNQGFILMNRISLGKRCKCSHIHSHIQKVSLLRWSNKGIKRGRRWKRLRQKGRRREWSLKNKNRRRELLLPRWTSKLLTSIEKIQSRT